MENNDYFAKALSDFTGDIAYKGAVRHLADLGYTVKEISRRLDYPVSEKVIGEVVWKRYIDTGIILEKSAENISENASENISKNISENASENISGNTSANISVHASENASDKAYFATTLGTREKVSYVREYDSTGKPTFRRVVEMVPGPDGEYIKCDFGLQIYKDSKAFSKMLEEKLSSSDRDYILGLPWPIRQVYHIKNERFSRICEALDLPQQLI